MSSPIHHPEDLDNALKYAPPQVRQRQASTAGLSANPPKLPRRRQTSRHGPGEFSGDRAMQELQRQLALNPDKVPEPPFEETETLWLVVLRICALAGVAAMIAGGIVLLPNAKKPMLKAVQTMQTALATPKIENRVTAIAVHVDPSAPLPERAQESTAASVQAMPSSPPLANASGSPDDRTEDVIHSAENTPLQERPRSAEIAPSLDGDEITMLIKRAQDLIHSGDRHRRDCCCAVRPTPATQMRRWPLEERLIQSSSASSV